MPSSLPAPRRLETFQLGLILLLDFNGLIYDFCLRTRPLDNVQSQLRMLAFAGQSDEDAASGT
jgi:hypothetical protein